MKSIIGVEDVLSLLIILVAIIAAFSTLSSTQISILLQYEVIDKIISYNYLNYMLISEHAKNLAFFALTKNETYFQPFLKDANNFEELAGCYWVKLNDNKIYPVRGNCEEKYLIQGFILLPFNNRTLTAKIKMGAGW